MRIVFWQVLNPQRKEVPQNLICSLSRSLLFLISLHPLAQYRCTHPLHHPPHRHRHLRITVTKTGAKTVAETVARNRHRGPRRRCSSVCGQVGLASLTPLVSDRFSASPPYRGTEAWGRPARPVPLPLTQDRQVVFAPLSPRPSLSGKKLARRGICASSSISATRLPGNFWFLFFSSFLILA